MTNVTMACVLVGPVALFSGGGGVGALVWSRHNSLSCVNFIVRSLPARRLQELDNWIGLALGKGG